MAAPRKWRQLLELLSGLKIPLNAGVGKVLSSDAEGNATWALPGEKSVAIAHRGTEQKIPSGVSTRVKLNSADADPGGNMDLVNGYYVVPSDGYYHVDGNVMIGAKPEFYWLSFIMVNEAVVAYGNYGVVAKPEFNTGLVATCVVFCKKGDHIELGCQYQGAETALVLASSLNRMSVIRVGEGPPGPENTLVETSIATAYRKAVQKVPSGAVTQLKLDTASHDPGANMDLVNGYYVVPADGYYHVDGEVLMAAKGFCAVYIFVSGSEALHGNEQVLTAEQAALGLQVNGIVFCKKGEHIELRVYQESGAEREFLSGAGTAQRLSVARVGSGPEGKVGPTGPEGKAGVWTAPTSLGAKVEQGTGQTVDVRLEGAGASARLRGTVKVKAGQELKPGEAILTLPAGFRPPEGNAHGCTVMVNKVTAAELNINSETGVVSIVSLSVTSAQQIALDGVTWNVT